METTETGFQPTGPAVRNGRRRRWLRRLGAVLVIVALLAADSALGIGVPTEPGTLHVFGRDYHRYHPCCEAVGYFGQGPNSMKWVKVFLGSFEGDPVIVHLEGFPSGWPIGSAESDATPATPPQKVFLQEGPDSYFPYVDAAINPTG